MLGMRAGGLVLPQESIHVGHQFPGKRRIILGPTLASGGGLCSAVDRLWLPFLMWTALMPGGSSAPRAFIPPGLLALGLAGIARRPLVALAGMLATGVHHGGASGHGEGVLLHHGYIAFDQFLDVAQEFHFLLVTE